MLEKQILKKVLEQLESYKRSGDILWYRREQNGLFYTRNGTPVKMGFRKNLDDGQDLDITVIVNCHNGEISVLFLDTKRSGVKKFDYEQEIFVKSMAGKPKILCSIINDPMQLGGLIKKAQKL